MWTTPSVRVKSGGRVFVLEPIRVFVVRQKGGMEEEEEEGRPEDNRTDLQSVGLCRQGEGVSVMEDH